MEQQDVVLLKAVNIEDAESQLPQKDDPEFLEHSIHWSDSGRLAPNNFWERKKKTVVLLFLAGVLVSAGLAWVAISIYFQAVSEPWKVAGTISEHTGISTNNSFDVYLIGNDQITLHPHFSLLNGEIFTNLDLQSQRIRSLDGRPLYCDGYTQEFLNQNDRFVFSETTDQTPRKEIVLRHSQGLVVRRESLKSIKTKKPLATMNYRVKVSKSPEGPFETVIFQRSFEMFEEDNVLSFAKVNGLYTE